MPLEPDSSPQSIAAGILAGLGDEPLIKPKAAKKTKTVAAALVEDGDIDPDQLAESMADEPEETETPEPKDGDDDQEEPTELDDQLAALAQNYGVDPELLQGAESVAEAERLVNRLYTVFAREGAATKQSQNGHAEPQQPMPAQRQAEPQKKTADALEIDLSKYDDDEPIKNDLKALLDARNADRAELAALRAERVRAQEEDFHRVQQDIQNQFINEFTRRDPELFGTNQKRSPVQIKKLHEVMDTVDDFIAGRVSRGKSLPNVDVIAEWSYNTKFAKELANKQVNNRSAKVQERVKRRSVGAPARVGRSLSNAPTGEVFEGPMDKDPGILKAINAVMTRSRS